MFSLLVKVAKGGKLLFPHHSTARANQLRAARGQES